MMRSIISACVPTIWQGPPEAGHAVTRQTRNLMWVEDKVMGKQIWKAGNMLYPLPAVLVSCARPKEKPNIFTVAWTGTVCTNPAMLAISVRPERYSYGIIKETGEFVVNLTTEKLARATDFCGVRSGRDIDKFRELGLHQEPSQQIDAPGIAESPVNIECAVSDVLELGSHHMFLANVLAVHVDEAYLDEKGRFRLNDAGLLTYSHGEYHGLGPLLGTFGYSVQKKAAARTGAKKIRTKYGK